MVRGRYVSCAPAKEWHLVSLHVCDLKLIVSKNISILKIKQCYNIKNLYVT